MLLMDLNTYIICVLVALGIILPTSISFLYAIAKIYTKLDYYANKFNSKSADNLLSSTVLCSMVSISIALVLSTLIVILLAYKRYKQQIRRKYAVQGALNHYRRRSLIFKSDAGHVEKTYKRSYKLQNIYFGSACISCIIAITLFIEGIILYLYNPFKSTLDDGMHVIHQSDVNQVILHNMLPALCIGMAVVALLIMIFSIYAYRKQTTSRTQFLIEFANLKEYTCLSSAIIAPPSYQAQSIAPPDYQAQSIAPPSYQESMNPQIIFESENNLESAKFFYAQFRISINSTRTMRS